MNSRQHQNSTKFFQKKETSLQIISMTSLERFNIHQTCTRESIVVVHQERNFRQQVDKPVNDLEPRRSSELDNKGH